MKKSANQIMSLIKSKLKTENIILWGWNEEAQEFYFKYKEIFRIKGCITEQQNHPKYLKEKEKEIEIMEWRTYSGDEHDYIIVFETPFVFIENQILASGLKIFEEYVDSRLVKAALSDKKIAIMAGNCQTGAVCDFLKEVKSFTDEYTLLRFATHYWKSRWSMKSLCSLKDLCDLYICMQHEEDDPMFFRPEELPANCKIVTIPSALTRLYWPQMDISWKGAINKYFIKNKATSAHGPFEYGDTNINRMIEEGRDIEEIVELLTSEEFYTEQQVERHISMMLRMLEYEEDRCDIKILPYIRENYKKKMLYRDMGHMQSCLLWEMVRKILKYLNMDTAETEKVEREKSNRNCQSYEGHCTEFPVYPSVAKHLGLQWCDKDTLYDVTFYNGRKKMTFEEYIRAYYSICSKVKQVLDEW